jgi:hypothetical protein
VQRHVTRPGGRVPHAEEDCGGPKTGRSGCGCMSVCVCVCVCVWMVYVCMNVCGWVDGRGCCV